MKIVLVLLTVLILFFGCSKKNDNTIKPTPPPKPDTLATGWSKVVINKDYLTDIYFVNNSIGYTTGPGGVYKSSDGGETWNQISNFGQGANMVATTNGKIFITGKLGVIYQSFDNGNTFIGYTTTNVDAYNDIYFAGNDTGYVTISNNMLLQTVNGGITWSYVTPVTGLDLAGVILTPFFINGTTGWISDGKEIFRTNGSVNKWIKCGFIGNQYRGNISIASANIDTVYIGVGGQTHALIYKSVNGGKDFYLTGTLDNNPNGYVAIHFIDSNNGYVSTNEKIYKTTNGGTTWENVVSLGEGSVVDISFTDANHGWACGFNGTVLIFKK